MLLKLTFIIV